VKETITNGVWRRLSSTMQLLA